MLTKRTGAVLIAVLTLLAGACSSDDGGDDDAGADDPTTTAGSGSTTAGDDGDAPAPELTAGECPFEAPTELQGEIRCGTVAVPVDHDDPVRLLASVAPALVEREVVVIDQRGIGESDPALDCPKLDEVAVDPGVEDEVVLAATEECHTALAEETDLSAYGTPANAADIDLVRQALDYEQINLMGTSYGSRLALEYARDHSDSLRSLVLNSPVPTDTSYFEDVPQNGDDALSALIAACEADVECARDNPDLNGSVEEALQRSEQAPEVAIEDPASGETVTVRATTAFVSYALFNTMYIGPLLGGLPQAITAAGEGTSRRCSRPPR